MDTMKACDTCGEEKIDSIEFFTKSKGIKPDGTPTTRGKCKKCANKAKTAKDKAKKNNILPVDNNPIERVESEELTEYQVSKKIEPVDTIEPMRSNTSNVPALTDNEILRLRSLLNEPSSNNNQFVVAYEKPDKSNRVVRSFTVDVDIFQWFKAKASEGRCSTSDILNQVMRRFVK